MIISLGDHFDKKTAWSLIYLMNYVDFDIKPIRKLWETPSISNIQTYQSKFML